MVIIDAIALFLGRAVLAVLALVVAAWLLSRFLDWREGRRRP